MSKISEIPETHAEFCLKWLKIARDDIKAGEYEKSLTTSYMCLSDTHPSDHTPEYHHYKQTIKKWAQKPTKTRAVAANRLAWWFKEKHGYLIDSTYFIPLPSNLRNEIIKEVNK